MAPFHLNISDECSKNQHYTKIFNYFYVLRCNITCFSSIGVTRWYNPKHLFRWWQRRSHWRQRRYRCIWKRRGDSFRSLVVNLSYWCWRQLFALSMVVSGSLYTANGGLYATYHLLREPKNNHWLFVLLFVLGKNYAQKKPWDLW